MKIDEYSRNIIASSGIYQQEKNYWLNKLEGIVEDNGFQIDLISDNDKDEYEFIKSKMPEGIYERLGSICNKSKYGMYIFLLACVKFLNHKYTGDDDITLCMPSFINSEGTELNNQLMLLRTVIKEDATFKVFLQDVKKTVDEARKYNNFPIQKILELLKIEIHNDETSIFNTVVYMEGIHNCDVANNYNPNIIISFHIKEESLEIGIKYKANLYKVETIEQIVESLMNLLGIITCNPNLKLSEIDIINEDQRNRILIDFNNTKKEYPKDKTIYGLFEEQVEKTPENIAVVYEDKELTYRELNEKSNSLARVLREKGVSPDSIVGIMVDRSLEMIIGIMGILKAGGAYLPIDTEYPQERIEYMLEDSNTKILLTQNHLINKVKFEGIIVELEDEELYKGNNDNLENVNRSSDLAYVIYTSGSTGKPKGVIIEHKSVVSLLTELQQKYPLSEKDAYLLKTNYIFDVSITELFGWFFEGGKLIVLENGFQTNPKNILDAIEKNGVTHINFVPSMLSIFVNRISKGGIKKINKLKYLFAAGEQISKNLVCEFQNLDSNVKLENLYGPTEATVYATMYSLIGEINTKSVSIGKPISNTKIYILAKNNNLQPVGVAGELCILGEGLARGYLNRPELTAEKFGENPYQVGERMYRTGDLARWLADGNIEYLGRIDYQVKIRGYRIELGEIENQLLKHEDIKEAVVVDREDKEDDKYLCAYIVCDRKMTVRELRESLSKKLPEYMIPAYFMQLEKMPLTPNGKLDRKALPEPNGEINTGVEYAAPRNEIEEKLVKVWREVLGSEKIGIDDNFFEIGGNSMNAIKVVSQLSDHYNITVNDVFEYKTISNISPKIKYQSDNLKELLQLAKDKEIDAAFYDKKVQNGYLKEVFDEYEEKNKSYYSIDIQEQIEYNGILLAGGTGYLGINILKELLENTKSDLYLLVRGKNIEDAKQRIIKKIEFFFGMDIYDKYEERLIIVNGDLDNDFFGLSHDEYYQLADKVQCVINSAANINHYGQYSDFYKINVRGTERLIEFAKINKVKDFNHISTISVASGILKDSRYTLFSEYDGDIGQDIDGLYEKSKLEAEKIVLKAREEGIRANIFRPGNIVFNSTSGKFQENINNNNFYQLVRGCLNLGIIPEAKYFDIDFSFVDYVSKAMVLLFNNKNLKNETYHLYNTKRTNINEISMHFSKAGYQLKTVVLDEFIEYLHNNNEDENVKTILMNTGIINASTEWTKFNWLSSKTELILNRLGFQWKSVNAEHISKMLEYCKEVGFL